MGKEIVILCGQGSLPLEFKNLAVENGYKVSTVGVKGITNFRTDFQIPFLGFIEFENILRKLKNPHIVMLGKFNPRLPFVVYSSFFFYLKRRLFSFLGKHNPEKNFHILETLRRNAKNGQPEELIKSFIQYMESKGFKFLPSEEIRAISKPLLAEEGFLTPQVKIDKDLLEEGKIFFSYAKRIADMDIGQTLVVKNSTVVAVEGLEGTNKTIERAYKLVGKGFSVIKVARTRQDFRIDVPTVGLETLKLLKRFGVKALFLEAGKVYISQKRKFLEEAQKANIAVVGIKGTY
jgi:DUF1009 family protein